MAIELLKGEKLKTAMASFRKRVRTWTDYVAGIGVSVVVHAAEHGDVSLLQQFYEHLPAAYTHPFTQWLGANGCAEWLAFADGNFSVKKDDKAKAARKSFAEDPPVEDWTEFRVQRVSSFNLEHARDRLIRLVKASEKHDVKLPDDAERGINMAIAALSKALEAQQNTQAA